MGKPYKIGIRKKNNESTDRRKYMKNLSVKVFIGVILIVFSLQNLGFTQKDGDQILRVVGKYRKIHSKVLNEDRMVFVSTPDDYGLSQKKYPVLFLFDAENRVRLLRSITTVEFFTRYSQIPKMVVVGILNTNRIRDLSPVPYKGIKNSGEGDNFLKFFTQELIPFVDKNYRTVNNRILFGGSAAGSFAIYTMIKYPNLFNAYIAGSPFLSSIPGYEWDTESIFRQFREILSKNKSFGKFLYLNYGSTENPEHYEKPIHRLANIIRENAPGDFKWELKVMAGEGHVPPTSLHDGLLALYSDWKLPRQTFLEGGLEKIKNHLDNLSRKHNYSIGIEDVLSEREINRVAYGTLRAGKMEEAIKLFKLNVKTFPQSWNVYDSLGEAYMKNGQKELAITNYKKSLKLNPENKNALEMLKKLGSGNHK
jgi:predicted alpha/beta superfamily hydrolase